LIGEDKITGVEPAYPCNDQELDIDDVELPAVDVGNITEPNQASQVVEIDDLDNTDLNLPLIESEPANTAPMTVQDTTDPFEVAVTPLDPVAEPATQEAPTNLRCSARVKTQPKSYEPTMTGTKYSYTVTQLTDQDMLNPDAHMFIQEDFYQVEPDVVAAVMTQLSLKSGLREWGDRAYDAAYSEMKQLHMRDTFQPKYYSELTPMQKATLLESHMFLKEK
jgi:hypothetical protein